jgi:MFS family permease
VLRNPALRRVVLAFFLFNAVEFGTWVAMLLYAYAAIGPATIGVVVLVQLLPAAIAVPFLASLADRYDRRLVLAGSYVAQSASIALAGLGMLQHAPSPLVLVAAAAVAMSTAATRPTQGAFLPAISRTPTELTAANGLAGTVEGLGLLGGPLGAAAILAAAAPAEVFLVGAVLCAIAAALVMSVRTPGADPGAVSDLDRDPDHDQDEDGHPHEGLLGGLSALRRRRDSRLVVALLGLRMVTSGGMDVLFVLLALDLFKSGDSGAAVLNASLGAGTVIGGAAMVALVGRQRLAPAMALSAGVLGGALAMVAVIDNGAFAPLLIAVAGFGYAAADVIGRIILQRVTPDEVLARVLGALEGVGLIGLVLGSLLVPPIAAVIGPQSSSLVVAALLPAGVVLAWRGLARIDREVKVPIRTLRLLRVSPVFAPLPPPQLEWLARRARWMTVETGQVVIREGDIGDAYYVLDRGRMEITRDGTELRIAADHAEGFGEIALLYGVRRTATVRALEPSVVLAVDRTDFLEVITGHEHARHIAELAASDRS